MNQLIETDCTSIIMPVLKPVTRRSAVAGDLFINCGNTIIIIIIKPSIMKKRMDK